jgi:hypothetical protein
MADRGGAEADSSISAGPHSSIYLRERETGHRCQSGHDRVSTMIMF